MTKGRSDPALFVCYRATWGTMLVLDHLVVIAPSLAEGLAHTRASLDIDLPEGGRHPEMGTRNHLVGLGPSAYLEVIAIDEEAEAPTHPRWFNLDDRDAVRADWNAGRRLRAWVARTADLDASLAAHGDLLGGSVRVSRGDRSWTFALRDDGRLPAEGAAPNVIDWGERGPPTAAMPDLGLRLAAFELEHPEPDVIAGLFRRMELADTPSIRHAPVLRLKARIATPRGDRLLT